MSSQFPNVVRDQELIGKFVSDFNKMFTETKYNLIALNKRFDLIEQCFNNVLLLNSTQAFNEKDNNQNELEFAPEDLEYINDLISENDKKENDFKDKNSNNKMKKQHKLTDHNISIDSDSDKEEKKEKEEKEYIPTGVKPEKKVGKYTEFLKFKQEKDKMLNALKQKKFPDNERKKGEDHKYIGIKRKKSNKKSN